MKYELFNSLEETQRHKKDAETVKGDLYTLWQECFHDSDSYMQFYFGWKLVDNRILTAYKGNRLSSMLHLNPYQLMVAGRKIPANYIVGVATRQQDRRQGLMRMLLEASLRQMYQEHMPFTYLMPAAEAIYLPFGFRTVYEQESWNLLYKQAGDRVRMPSLNDGDGLAVTALAASDRAGISKLVEYSNALLSGQYDIYTYRTEYYYYRLIHEMESTGGSVLLCYDGGRPIGYVSYMAEGDIYITECLCDGKDRDAVMYAVRNYISGKASLPQIPPVRKTGNNEPEVSIMMRIIDWASFAALLTAEERLTFTVEVKDPIIQENNGIYTLRLSPQGCIAERTQAEPEVFFDIAGLTAFLFGRLQGSDVPEAITGPDQENIGLKLDKINKFDKIFINDVV